MGFSVPKPQYDYERRHVAEGSSNIDHLVFFNVNWHCTVHGPLQFRPQQNASATAGIKPVTFGSVVEHPSHCSAEADNKRNKIQTIIEKLHNTRPFTAALKDTKSIRPLDITAEKQTTKKKRHCKNI